MTFKPNQVFIDVYGSRYKIKDVRDTWFTYYFKKYDADTYTYSGVKGQYLIEEEIQSGRIMLETPAATVLFSVNNSST